MAKSFEKLTKIQFSVKSESPGDQGEKSWEKGGDLFLIGKEGLFVVLFGSTRAAESTEGDLFFTRERRPL